MSVKFISVPSKRLAASITSAATGFQLNNIKDWAGTDLTAADFGSTAYGVLRNDSNTLVEIFEFDPATIANSSITFTRRGLGFEGNLTTETTAYKLSWIKNETIVEIGSHPPQLFQYLKEYIDAAAIAGAVDATSSVKGIIELGTLAEVNAGTATGGTGAALVPSLDILETSKYNRGTDYYTYAADSVGSDSYAITVTPAPTAYAAGQTYKFKAGTANTGTASLNVNSLGAVTIKKNVSEDLITGDITANQMITVMHDGTNFQIVNKTQKSVDIQTFTSSGTWTKPAGAVVVEVTAIGGGGGGGRPNTSSNTAGGGGGGGCIRKVMPASLLSSTETVTVGTGGAGASANNTSGVAGIDSTFGVYVRAGGGSPGQPANIGGAGGVGAAAGSAQTVAALLGGAGGGNNPGGIGVVGGAASAFGAAGGGGGGDSSGNSGGNGGSQSIRGTTISGGAGGSGIGGNGAAPTDISASEFYPGAGGGGGDGNSGGAAGNGGSGGKFGGGGGGGGSGVTSGNGGSGGDGIVVVISYF